MQTAPLIPVILSGGSGSRLWPVSREQHPKPFIRLNDGYSLLQKAFQRGASLDGVSNIITVTNQDLLFKTQNDYSLINQQLNNPMTNHYILEPFGRNTAPAIAIASLLAKETYGEDAILLVLAADHLITKQAAFAQAVKTAMTLAQQGNLVTFGIQPTSPETGYGYIEADHHNVKQFVEKPDLETALDYLSSGNFLWNSGMFCFQVSTLLKEMKEHCPKILQLAQDCYQQSKQPNTEIIHLNPQRFAEVPDDSIDYAVMEKTQNAAVVACDIGWSDIGCWRALGDLTQADNNNNRIQGQVLIQDSKNCTIKAHNRIVGAVGVENLVIIDTDDALLVADKSKTQQVKNIFNELKAQGHDSYKLHKTVHRPWGTYTVLEEGSHFKIKRIEVLPQARLSLQMHHHRSEHWIVVTGTAKVLNDEHEFILNVNESTYIPAQHKHRLENIGTENLVIIEVQTGSYLGEDDIIRFQDIYGRAQCST